MSIPRAEYPRPQFRRDEWLCLNGEWEFEIDNGDSGIERGLLEQSLSDTITVPFCPESKLSGINNTDFMSVVWYRRHAEIPENWEGRNVLLHFQAVDYDTTVWVNGKECIRHRGGFSPFSMDITSAIENGKAEIIVRARDFNTDPKPRGKQSQEFENVGCLYTRTTGIWQTVWMEPIAPVSMKRPRITPDTGRSCFDIEIPLSNNKPGTQLRGVLLDGDTEIASETVPADGMMAPRLCLVVPQESLHLWDTEDPFLYNLVFFLEDETGIIDTVYSYAGMRSIAIDGKRILINGKPVFQRLVLDQGYYADGILTAPTDEDLKKDIDLSIQAGFNGARLHQKVFEERFLYYCDTMGYIVWGEFADWGCRIGGRYEWKDMAQTGTYITQWLEVLERDYSHPSIVGWCPLNETHEKRGPNIVNLDDITRGMFLAAKAYDTTRPVLDTSGYSHRVFETDVYDSHNYEQDPRAFAALFENLKDNQPYINAKPERNEEWSLPYNGQPYFCSEFGGIKWAPEQEDTKGSWGYGQTPKTLNEFYDRFEKLCGVLLDNPDMFGYCYTQLTDVFQEQNGIYNFDRSCKFDMERIRKAQIRKAAFEA